MSTEEIGRCRADFTTKMESHVGNYSKATIDTATDYDETDSYRNLFDIDDDLSYDENIEFVLDAQGNVISKPATATFLAHDAPF